MKRLFSLVALLFLLPLANAREPDTVHGAPIYTDAAAAESAAKKDSAPVAYWIGGILESPLGKETIEAIGYNMTHCKLVKANDGYDEIGPRVRFVCGESGKTHYIRQEKLTKDSAEKIMRVALRKKSAGLTYYTSNGVKYHTSVAKAKAEAIETRRNLIVWVGLNPEDYAGLCKSMDDCVQLSATAAQGIPHGSILFQGGDGNDHFIRADEIGDHTADNIRAKWAAGSGGTGRYERLDRSAADIAKYGYASPETTYRIQPAGYGQASRYSYSAPASYGTRYAAPSSASFGYGSAGYAYPQMSAPVQSFSAPIGRRG